MGIISLVDIHLQKRKSLIFKYYVLTTIHNLPIKALLSGYFTVRLSDIFCKKTPLKYPDGLFEPI